jgi:hypothetical protein
MRKKEGPEFVPERFGTKAEKSTYDSSARIRRRAGHMLLTQIARTIHGARIFDGNEVSGRRKVAATMRVR